MAIHADQQSHRDQRPFPEEVEQEQVQRGENADQGRLKQQQQNEKFLYALMYRGPGNQHAERRQECGQHHQPDGNSVNAHVVVNVGRSDPDFVDLELKNTALTMEVHRQVKRGHKCQDGNDERK